MPEYLAPGVYVEEVSTGPRPIEGVSTSTTGMVGETERGPLTPKMVTSWEDYRRWYGGYIDRPGGGQNVFLPYAVRGFFDNGGQRLFIARVAGPAALPAAGAIGNLNIRAIGPGLWGDNIVIRVQAASAAGNAPAGSPVQGWFRITILYFRDGVPAPWVDPLSLDPADMANPARRTPDMTEDYDNLSNDPTAGNFVDTVINGASRLIAVTAGAAPPPITPFPNARLQNGADDPATVVQYQGDDAQNPTNRSGLAALCDIREISLLTIPDEVNAPLQGLASDLVNRCELLKDRFAILNEQADTGTINQIRPPRDSSYGAIYYPRVRVSAPHTAEGHRLIPASGHVAGIYARVDVERGVHKAPANEVVRGIVTRDLNPTSRPLSHTLPKAEHDILNPRGVNVIRDFRSDGRDIRVWGARTMSSDAMWKYVNVRRLFIFVEQSIDRGTQWAVFEPNSEPTWVAIRTSISAFLRTVWRNGALMGTTPDEAFFVKCDRTTMTQDDFDNGRLICLIGIAPVKPAEFVIFRISQKTLDSES